MRLQQYMARAGVASRRKSEEIILQGRVQVNGKLATLGQSVSPEDNILLDNKPLLGAESFVYFAFNKPQKVLSTVSDPRGRKTVLDFYQGNKRIFPVGRLDYESRGLLLCTNDGDFAQLFIHPRYGIEKDYLLILDNELTKEELRSLEMGIYLDGYKTKPIKIHKLGERRYRVTLVEGRNRQLRRMVEKKGKTVLDLSRVRVGPFHLENIPEGEFLPLKIKDIEKLKNAIRP
ncbi:MAG: rRNA pseudouridine synthase [Tissierellia bacterium]|nr:rRNA pseudouridine synthase [Tissierellia bacterium]